MKTRTTLFAMALALTPSLAFAWGGCSTMKPEPTASACAEGQVWDSTTMGCVTPVSS